MQVNNEQTNTQRMLQHNQMKEKAAPGGSLQRTLVDVVENNIDSRESTILNCLDSSSTELKTLFTPIGDATTAASTVESDADAQLLIKVKFVEKVDACKIFFHPPAGSETNAREVSNARTVKLFVNANDLDFNDVESATPALQIELPFEYEATPFSVTLAGAKFTRLASLQIFVEDNYGTDFSQLGRIKLEGFIAPSYHTK